MDEELLSLVPTAIVLVLFTLAFVNVLVDFQVKRSDLETRQVALSLAQQIALSKGGVLKQSELPAALTMQSSQYNVSVNFTDLESGQSWVYGSSSGAALASLPMLLERSNGSYAPGRLAVKVGIRR